MSLLLQALQKAAKNRESTAPVQPEPVPPPPPELVTEAVSSDFELEEEIRAELGEPEIGRLDPEPEMSLAEEDLFEPEQIPPSTPDRFEPFASAPASSSSAASILRASETPTAGWMDWVRDHPVHSFAAVAGVFMLFYGGYRSEERRVGKEVRSWGWAH